MGNGAGGEGEGADGGGVEDGEAMGDACQWGVLWVSEKCREYQMEERRRAVGCQI